MTRAANPAEGAASSPKARTEARGYFQRSELPITSLLFLLPLLVLYEVGTHYFNFDPVHGTEQRIIAFNLLRRFFQLFNASGRYLPAMAVVGILLTWHIARNDSWKLHFGALPGMVLECCILAIPLILFSLLASQYVPLLTGDSDWRGLIVLSIGAGIYEELVFRLICFTLLDLLLISLLQIKRPVAVLLMVVTSAVLFACYHYLGNESFRLRSFAFRTLAGIYFGVVFAIRGFGITAGSHAAYDIITVLFAASQD
jgi:membrane protease YdiL (CAAX protease family)